MPHSKAAGATAYGGSIARQAPLSNLILPIRPSFALHVAEEGAVEPVAAANLLLEDAARQGATLLYGTEARRLLQDNGKITGVATTDGALLADHVVLAAGAGTAALAASVGIDVPIETPPGLIVHSRPCPRLLNGLVMAPGLHMRQTAEGRIIAGSDFGGTDPGDNPQKAADELFAKVKAMLRGGDSARTRLLHGRLSSDTERRLPDYRRCRRSAGPLSRRPAFRRDPGAARRIGCGSGDYRRLSRPSAFSIPPVAIRAGKRVAHEIQL